MHQPIKVMDIEHELRCQIREKCTISVALQNELVTSKKADENTSQIYHLVGVETLGSILRIQTCPNGATDVAKCSIQWYHLSSQCSIMESILDSECKRCFHNRLRPAKLTVNSTRRILQLKL